MIAQTGIGSGHTSSGLRRDCGTSGTSSEPATSTRKGSADGKHKSELLRARVAMSAGTEWRDVQYHRANLVLIFKWHWWWRSCEGARCWTVSVVKLSYRSDQCIYSMNVFMSVACNCTISFTSSKHHKLLSVCYRFLLVSFVGGTHKNLRLQVGLR